MKDSVKTKKDKHQKIPSRIELSKNSISMVVNFILRGNFNIKLVYAFGVIYKKNHTDTIPKK